MFKPVRAPKEGRSPPGLLYSGPTSSRRQSQRQVLLAVIILVCLGLGYMVFTSEAGVPATQIASKLDSGLIRRPDEVPLNYDAKDVLSDDSQAAPGVVHVPDVKADRKHRDEDEGTREGHDFKPLGDNLKDVYQEPHSQPSVKDIKEEKNAVEEKQSSPKGSTPANGKGKKGDAHPKSDLPPEHWAERASFERALTAVVTMLPDEVHMRELIRPVEGTGKEKLREMGLRTKAYKKYFDAWEALHLTNDDEGATYVRDDVVQYLRAHQHIQSMDDFGSETGLAAMDLAQIIRSYESYRTFMAKFANLLFPWTAPYFADHMSLHAHFKKGGKGIVLTAGDDQAPYLLTTIYTFRKLGCTLPIEVMYLGDQDLGEDYRTELEALDGVVTRDIAQMVNDEGWKLAGWAAKPFAMLFSSFREVIFIDADSLFFRNPASLFEDPQYQETGALFFRDRLIMPEVKKRWLQAILPKPIPRLAKQSRFWTGESGHMQESGVVVIDKWRHFVSLLLVTRMNGPDRDGNKEQGRIGVYDMVYGDKETFWVGFLLAGDESYAFHQGDAGIMGVVKNKEELEADQRKKDEKMGKKVEAKPKDDKPKDDKPKNDKPKENRDDKADEKNDGFGTAGQQHALEEMTTVSDPILHGLDPDTDLPPDNYTICAPQLLHLDLEGRPYWFNGWLLHNKFADKTKKKFANFESYLIEPRDVRDPGAWQLAEANNCCLTSDNDKKFEFTDEEREVLAMIMERAHEVGMGDQK